MRDAKDSAESWQVACSHRGDGAQRRQSRRRDEGGTCHARTVTACGRSDKVWHTVSQAAGGGHRYLVLVSRRREVYYYQCGGCLSERGGARPRAQRSFHVAQALELVPRRVRLRKPACGTACVKPHGHGAHFLARAAALCPWTRGKWNGNSTIRFAAWWGRGSACVARAAVAQTHTCQAARGGARRGHARAPRKLLGSYSKQLHD